MDEQQIKKVFPSYFENFQLPSSAKEQEIVVFRACRTHKIERESFLDSFEENGFTIPPDCDISDPQQYSLSTYFRLKDVKRFVIIDSKYNPPFLLAKGHTTITDGVSCKSQDWKKCKSSHVDWWLYVGAKPWLAFEETTYEQESEQQSFSTEK